MPGVPIDDQLAAVHGDSLRVLVIGAGVAGATLAQLLRGQGPHPVLVERASTRCGQRIHARTTPAGRPGAQPTRC